MIQEKAILIAAEQKLDDFTDSNGWLNQFQARHNIKCSVLSGESADINPEIIEDWSKRLSSICKNYDPADMLNCDETGLFYRALPTRSIVEKRRYMQWRKEIKRQNNCATLCQWNWGENKTIGDW